MSDERTSSHIENEESGLLLSVESNNERSLEFTALSDDTDATDTADTDTEDNVGDTDGTDADTDTTDDSDGTD